MNRREFIRGVGASAAVAAMPAAVAAPPFEDLDPGRVYALYLYGVRTEYGGCGDTIWSTLLRLHDTLHPDCLPRDRMLHPDARFVEVTLRHNSTHPRSTLFEGPDGSRYLAHQIRVDGFWLREFYRRHA